MPTNSELRDILSGAIMMMSGLRAAVGGTDGREESGAASVPGQARQASQVQIWTQEVSTMTSPSSVPDAADAADADDDNKISWKGKHSNDTWKVGFEDKKYRKWYMGRVESGLSPDKKAFAKYCIRKDLSLDG
jgi:hypothetical protein